MALSAIALCSRALLRVGATTIASFDDGTAESEVAANLYPPLRDAVLSSHPWSFATAQATLPRLAGEPLADYGHAYQLPADFLRVLSAGPSGRGHGLTYRIAENRLLCDADEVVLTYVFRPDESGFPPFFDQMLIARLTAEFCIPITESTTRAQFLFRLAEDEFRRAKLIDGQQHTPPAISDFPLVEVRS
ncbi:hypothetical protein CU669_01580 [Paramagnetospirillum kuznetsovii]|uniref:Uncharacterized protein n=1 Tax=Paramagnetospirillum kuznetsovii TaxID=2053833 RepID=A0A364P3E1_9PROT|nr:hypothetical protein [Paramagnetospirillum kuznetsovii]RAU23806.1 hypothetical protein CU669_01580 [Paramagnetospirillum kuznetsovii]